MLPPVCRRFLTESELFESLAAEYTARRQSFVQLFSWKLRTLEKVIFPSGEQRKKYRRTFSLY